MYMDVIAETKKLNLPAGEFIILGSGILGALGLRDIHDIDLLVSPRVFATLQEEGWEYDEPEFDGRTRQRLRKGIAEAFKDFWYGNENPDPKKMIAEAVTIEDIPFLSLERLLEVKHAFDRPKDRADVEMIERYLKER